VGLPAERLGLAYVHLPSFIGQIQRSVAAGAGGQAAGPALPLGLFDAYRGAGLAVSAEPSGFAVDVNVSIDASALSEELRRAVEADGDASALLTSIPDDAYGFFAAGGADASSWITPEQSADPNFQALDQAAGLTAGLEHLDGNLAFEVGPGPREYPDGAVLLGTTDDQGMIEALNRIEAMVGQFVTAAGSGGKGAHWQSATYRSVRIATVRIPELRPFGVAPSYAVDSGLVIIGSSRDEVKRVLDARDGGTSITTTENFRGAHGQVGDSASVLLYADLEAVIGALRDAMPRKDRRAFDGTVAPNLAPLKALIIEQRGSGDRFSGRMFLLIR
jgi:hypothetical protein